MLKKLLILAMLIMSPLAFSQDAKPIKVGVLAPLTGFAASDGHSVSTGIELAAETINKNGGILGRPIKLVTYNDQADPKQAVNFARRLIGQDEISFAILASYSGATLAAADVFNDKQIPAMAAYAVAPGVTANHPYIFRMVQLGTTQGRVGALLADKLGAETAAILTIQNDFGQALETGFRAGAKKRGIDIVYHSTYPLGNKNFTSILIRLKATHPDVIYASGYYTEAANLVRQARSLGIQAQIIGQQGYDSPKFMALAGAAANGVMITTTLDRDSDDPQVQAFLAEYKKTAGRPADMVGASGYAALMTMAKAVNKAGALTGDDVRKALQSMKDVDTIIGNVFYWNDNGDPVKAETIQIVKDGQFHRYKTIDNMKVLTQ